MKNSGGGALCRFLDWDTDFFGVRTARLRTGRLSRAQMKRALQWCRRRKIECLYFTVDAGDLPTIRVAEDHRFRLVDLRVTYERKAEDPGAVEAPAGVEFRLGGAKDIPALEAIAATAYRDSRFYADPKFKRALCDELYRVWIRKSCRDYADAVWVAQLRGAPVGYVTCHLRPGRLGEIGLVGVSGKARGKGLGGLLTREALRWFSSKGVERVSVVTQGRNVAAQRVYQRAGFLVGGVEQTYHLWPGES